MSRAPEVLSEYESRDIALSAEGARELKRLSDGSLGISPGSAPGTYSVRATQFVGTVVHPEVSILVRPKVGIQNVFFMLGAGIGRTRWQAQAFPFGASPNLLPSFAAFFAHTVDRALAAGLVRSYVEERDTPSALRGRIDFATLSRRTSPFPLPCVYDEFTANIPENQLLKTALIRLLRMPGLAGDSRRQLLLQLSRFEDVSEVLQHEHLWDRVQFNRMNEHYRPILGLAKLVLHNTTLIDQVGSASAGSFMIDMNLLYQDFLTEELRHALRGQLRVEGEPKVYLDRGNKVGMEPDLVFSRGTTRRLVGDAKYKLTGTGFARAGDYYQLLAYTIAMNLPAGVLIYCRDERGWDAAPSVVRVRHAGKTIYTYQVPLAGDFTTIRQSIGDLADWILEHSGAQMAGVSRVA